MTKLITRMIEDCTKLGMSPKQALKFVNQLLEDKK